MHKSIFSLLSLGYSLVFQTIEGFVESQVVPFDGSDLIVLHARKGIDQMSTEAWVDVIRHEAPKAWSVLGPVGEVACQQIGRTCFWPRGGGDVTGIFVIINYAGS